jgi:colicin import membrane protein
VNTATINAGQPGLTRDPFMPTKPKGRGMALVLALLAHALLIVAIAFSVDWRNSEPTTMAAELWSAVPQIAAPRAVEPPPTSPAVTKRTETAVKPPPEPVTPPKPTPALPDPQIAIEKAKREEAKREKAEQDQEDKLERQKQAAQDDAAKKDKAAKAKAEQDKVARESAEKEKAAKADAAKQEAIRQANLKRIQGMAGATGAPTDTGNALHSSGPSASYAGRIMARIKPNIVLTDTVDGNPKAVVELKVAPDGTIMSKRLIQSSGAKAWDDAVLRAIDRTDGLPRDIDGSVPPSMTIGFTPRG